MKRLRYQFTYNLLRNAVGNDFAIRQTQKWRNLSLNWRRKCSILDRLPIFDEFFLDTNIFTAYIATESRTVSFPQRFCFLQW